MTLDVVSADYGSWAVVLSSTLASRIPVAMWLPDNLQKFVGCAQRVAEFAELTWEASKDDWRAFEAARGKSEVQVE